MPRYSPRSAGTGDSTQEVQLLHLLFLCRRWGERRLFPHVRRVPVEEFVPAFFALAVEPDTREVQQPGLFRRVLRAGITVGYPIDVELTHQVGRRTLLYQLVPDPTTIASPLGTT